MFSCLVRSLDSPLLHTATTNYARLSEFIVSTEPERAFANGCRYVHRVGRTGRAGQSGVALTLFSPADAGLRAELDSTLGESESIQVTSILCLKHCLLCSV